MAQIQRLGKTATSVREEAGYTVIRYHQTDVVKFNEREIILNTGGWFTVTTKTRMNQASNQFNLGFYVHQKDGEWYVTSWPVETFKKAFESDIVKFSRQVLSEVK